MGGRGASSGISNKNNKYGSQYHTVLTHGNIKFVVKNDRHSESLLETMTKGRVYVRVGGNDILQITYFDKNNKRSKTIDLNHKHNNLQPHVHHGYEHNEFDGVNGATRLTSKEQKMVDRIRKIWYDYKDK
nr:MAG TPA: hypothetical protein [Caudoviricetes sp.]